MSAYIGNELEIFLHAQNWKKYWADFISPYVRDEVAEVGSGIGANTPMFCGGRVKNLICIEPDGRLIEQAHLRKPSAPHPIEWIEGTLSSLDPARSFDSLVYIDVLEHIEDDAAEVARAVERLKPGGHLIVLCPAHQWLYSPFDKAIGHYRRYSRDSMTAVFPKRGGEFVERVYLDSIGMAASLMNKAVMRQSMPNYGQIRLWDTWMVPLSKYIDPLLGRNFGKTVVFVWRKNDA